MIMGRNSGVRPTASATAKRSDSRNASMQQRAGEQDEEHEEEHRPRDEERELPRAALELGLGRTRRQARGNVAERGRRPRRDDQRPSPSRSRPTCRGRRRCGHPPVGAARPRGRPPPSQPASTRPSGPPAGRGGLASRGGARRPAPDRPPPAGRCHRGPGRAARTSLQRSIAEGGRRRRDDVAQSLRDSMGAIGLNEVEHHTRARP